MIVPGTLETLHIIDGSPSLSVMRALRSVDDVVALAAPALAGAADAIEARSGSGEPGPDLSVRLETLLQRCATRLSSGLADDPPPYRLLGMGGRHIRMFALVRRAVTDRFNLFDAQVAAIALSEDAEMLLFDRERNREARDRLVQAGLSPRMRLV